jgi:hypothetical protein
MASTYNNNLANSGAAAPRPGLNGPGLIGPDLNGPGLNEYGMNGSGPGQNGNGPNGHGANEPDTYRHGLSGHDTGFFGTFGTWVSRGISVSYIGLLYIGAMCLFVSILLTCITFDPPGKL